LWLVYTYTQEDGGGGGDLQGTQSHSSEQNRGQPLPQRWDSKGLTSKQTKQYMRCACYTDQAAAAPHAALLYSARVAVDVMTMMPPRVRARQAAGRTLLCAAGCQHAAHSLGRHVT